MGLDMYAYTRDPRQPADAEPTQLAYWRKHNALHGWMERLWVEKGCPGAAERGNSFNCLPLALTAEDLDRLEAAVRANALEPTEGFFFGPANYDTREYVEDDLNFITLARTALAEGLHVYYDSWW